MLVDMSLIWRLDAVILVRIAWKEAFNLTLHSLLTSHAHMRTRISSHIVDRILFDPPCTVVWWHFAAAHDTTQRIHSSLNILLGSAYNRHP
jgi:hypothetical protein